MSMFGFLGNALSWVARQTEGEKAGTATVQEIEASPFVRQALQAGEQAVEAALIGHVSSALHIEPTAQGVTGFLGGLIDRDALTPAPTKEALKLYLATKISGGLSPAAVKAAGDADGKPLPQSDPPKDAAAQAEAAATKALLAEATTRIEAIGKGGQTS